MLVERDPHSVSLPDEINRSAPSGSVLTYTPSKAVCQGKTGKKEKIRRDEKRFAAERRPARSKEEKVTLPRAGEEPS
jgi:hypothetical protein